MGHLDVDGTSSPRIVWGCFDTTRQVTLFLSNRLQMVLYIFSEVITDLN